MHAWRLAIVAILFGLASFSSTAVAVVTVNDSGDGGPGNCTTICTLRDAIAAAASGDTIDFALALPGAIMLTQGQLVIAKSLTILGPGAAQLTVSANNLSRVLSVNAGTLAIAGVTLSDGKVTGGNGSSGLSGTGQPGQAGSAVVAGCILVAASSSLVLNQADVRNCSATGGRGGDGGSGTAGGTPGQGGVGGSGGGAIGGGIYTTGNLTLTNSTLTSASATGGGGGNGGDGGTGTFFNGAGANGGSGAAGAGGAIYVANGGGFLIQNSTLASSSSSGGKGGNGGNGGSVAAPGNGAGGGNADGGLVYVEGAVNMADLEFATLAEGTVFAGSGGLAGTVGNPAGTNGQTGLVHGAAISAAGTVTALSSVVVGTAATALCSGGVAVSPGSANLDEDNTCPGFTLQGTFAQIFRPLNLATTRLPGFTPVYHSAVIDAAATCNDLTAQSVTSDQHGTPRPQGSACDLGAIEADYIFFNGFD